MDKLQDIIRDLQIYLDDKEIVVDEIKACIRDITEQLNNL